jgi:hypothetical protein
LLKTIKNKIKEIFLYYNPYSADTKANLGIKNLEKVKPEKIAQQRFRN